MTPSMPYRYTLTREIPMGGPTRAAIIMVNPSTADHQLDDPTIRKVRGFMARAGFGRFDVGNLFAWRATDVRLLRTAPDPVGCENDYHLSKLMHEADAVVVAWGTIGKLPRPLRSRWRQVVDLAQAAGKPLQCFGCAKDGHPLHPLTLGYDRALQPWTPP